MPNRLFQGIINQMREVLDRTIGVVDESGTVIACSELGQIGEARTILPQRGRGTVRRTVEGVSAGCQDARQPCRAPVIFHRRRGARYKP